ncbi:uncharacterized mitochondrial protein AtMg00810-like [Vitis riparia]|uniref:uncharacterized mitochondrial protein AtMg00810-like n=1 Tax=Vitis riparia TaxID=96939 RepID=UPI00155A9A78|nr:uncharacterized mitochondrial protein AtMg00810-like [Vitis riparia]
MEECKPTSTPMNQKEKFCKEDGAEKVDEGLYRSMIGCLMYLTATRPDIMHVVSLLSRYMHCASEIHFQAAKRVIRYVKGTVDYGIKFSQVQSFNFHGFSDSDWAGCVDDMRSTSGYCFSFGSGVFSWSSRKQEVVAQSTAEAEYIAAVAAVNQALWLRKLLTDLDMKQEVSTKVFVDNQATISIANDPVFHDLSFYEKDLEFAAPKSRRSVESYALVAAEGKAEIESQILPTVRAYGLEGFLTGDHVHPPAMVADAKDPQVFIENPDFLYRTRYDQFLVSWLIGSISEAMLGHVIRCTSTAEI